MAANGSTEADSGAIAAAAAKIGDGIETMRSVYAETNGNLMGRLDPYWEGEARDSFEKSLNEFTALLDKFINDHAEVNARLMRSASVYGRADDTARRIAGNLAR